jgi:hypothetical protein
VLEAQKLFSDLLERLFNDHREHAPAHSWSATDHLEQRRRLLPVPFPLRSLGFPRSVLVDEPDQVLEAAPAVLELLELGLRPLAQGTQGVVRLCLTHRDIKERSGGPAFFARPLGLAVKTQQVVAEAEDVFGGVLQFVPGAGLAVSELPGAAHPTALLGDPA